MSNLRSNHLFANLPDGEVALFEPHLELLSLTKEKVLFDFDEVPEHVYFPIGAIVSVFCELEDGGSVETAMVGKTGMVGLSNSGQPSFYKAVVKGSGLAYRIKLSSFLKVRHDCPVFLDNYHDAIFASFRNIHFVAACGKLHSVDQQIVRWLLTNLDRSASNTVMATHAEIAKVLGFRREAVTLALGKLIAGGLIVTSRGLVEVPDRNGLEKRSCECYWLANGMRRPRFEALLGDASPITPPPRTNTNTLL